MSIKKILYGVWSMQDKIQSDAIIRDGKKGPDGSHIATGFYEFQIAQLGKAISKCIHNKSLRNEIFATSKLAFKFSVESMTGSFDDFDGPWCGNDLIDLELLIKWLLGHRPPPSPWTAVMMNIINPDPSPWKGSIAEINDILSSLADNAIGGLFKAYGFNENVVYAECLRNLAALTTHKDVSDQFIKAAKGVMNESGAADGAKEIFDEMCGSTGPRYVGPRGPLGQGGLKNE